MNAMKSAAVFFVVALFLPVIDAEDHHSSCSLCKVPSMKQFLNDVVSCLKPECKSVSARGATATCPEGYIAHSCSCGMACGSWDIPQETTCHCQCANIDWTAAVCCRTVVK
ncbi:resistin-like [Lissotriton helveticus]